MKNYKIAVTGAGSGDIIRATRVKSDFMRVYAA